MHQAATASSPAQIAHRHDVQFYADDTFLAQAVGSFIATGLRNGRAALVIATPDHWTAIGASLDRQGIDVESMTTTGQLISIDAAAALARFMVEDVPDHDRFDQTVGHVVRQACAIFPGLCAYGEMVDLLCAEGNLDGTIALEHLWNHLLEGRPAHLLCGYRLDRFGSDAHAEPFRHICQAHTAVVPSEAYTQLEIQKQSRMIADLQQRAQALESEVQERRRVEQALRKTQDHLREKADELIRSNAELERFAYISAHDLKEPLRMVSQFMDLLNRRYANQLDERARSYIGYAVTGTQRMQDLIDALLSYSHAGCGALKPTTVDLNVVVDDLRQSLQVAIADAGAELRTQSPLPTVQADAHKMRQVFQNLIENGLKYRSHIAPVIQFSASEQKDHWVLSVQDNGIGISVSHHQRIFDLFERLHTREDIPGTGIGLAVTRRVIEQHRGRIWVESGLGSGATFRFTLPR